jgi:hypothetical protein
MFNYDVMCLICGENKVYQISFKDKISEKDLTTNKSMGVCKGCGPTYMNSIKNKTKLNTSNGPFFVLKDGE